MVIGAVLVAGTKAPKLVTREMLKSMKKGAVIVDVAIDQGVTGLIQLSNGLGISKYDLLHLFSRIWHKRDVEILPFDGNGIDKSIAKSARFSYVVPGYEEMLREQYDWMQNKQELYRTLYL